MQHPSSRRELPWNQNQESDDDSLEGKVTLSFIIWQVICQESYIGGVAAVLRLKG